MKLYRDARPKVDILANAFDFGSLMIVTRTYAFSDDIPVCAAAHEFHFLHDHDVMYLLPDLFRPSQGLGVKEVSNAPTVRVAIASPLTVNMQQGEMVGFWDEEFLPCCVRLFLTLFRAIEDARYREHTDDCENLFGASIEF